MTPKARGWRGDDQTARAGRRAIWRFLEMDLRRLEPVAIEAAADAFDRLRGAHDARRAPRFVGDRLDAMIAYLDAAIWDGRVDFERLPDPERRSGSVDQRSVGPIEPRAATRHWLEVEVVDDEDGAPVEGLRVTLELADGCTVQATTNADGLIRVDGQPHDDWSILDVKAPVEIAGVVLLPPTEG